MLASGLDLAQVGGFVLRPTYAAVGAGFALSGPLTLDAEGNESAVWIFQMESTLITASDSSVVLINGAQACNVFWQVGSSATLGTGTEFQGNILAQASITLNTGATLEGRALARTGAVTLENNVITAAECAPVDEPPGDEPPGDEPPGDQPPGDQPPGDEPVACSTDLEATANEDSSIKLTWKPVAGADQHRIYRAEGDGGFVLHGEVDGEASSFIDTDTEVGVTYSYEVRPVVAGVESQDCEVVEVTAIPFFPGLLAGALALVGCVAAYSLGRRRT